MITVRPDGSARFDAHFMRAVEHRLCLVQLHHRRAARGLGDVEQFAALAHWSRYELLQHLQSLRSKGAQIKPMVQYGDAGLLRGDMVPVTAGTVTLNAVLSECTFTWDNQVGLVVTPIVGQVLDSARQLSRFINRLRRDVHLQQVK